MKESTLFLSKYLLILFGFACFIQEEIPLKNRGNFEPLFPLLVVVERVY
jgi:hypothetical protein